MSQVTKLLLKIVMDRMKTKIEAERDDAQSGFRQGKVTRKSDKRRSLESKTDM